MSSNISECGISNVLLFLFTALLRAYTSICSKVIVSMPVSESEQKLFQKPLFITFCMSVGTSFALIMHVFVVFFKIPFPGYDHHLLSAMTIDSECSEEGDYHSPPTDHQIINSTYQPPKSNLVNPPQRISMLGDSGHTLLTTIAASLTTCPTDSDANNTFERIHHKDSNDTNDASISISGYTLLPTNTDSLTSQTNSNADNTFGKIHHNNSNETSDETSNASIILIDESDSVTTDTANANVNESETKLPLSVYFIMAVPAILDLGSSALLLAGLVYLDPSIFQMIKNSQFLFVALMKHYILKNLLYKFHWVGVFWIVVSVLIGGSSALLMSLMSGNVTEDGSTATDTLIGVALVIAGTVICSLMCVIMEKMLNYNVPVPPLLLIGMIGFWEVVLSIFVMFPVGYAVPGNDQGSFENPFDSWSVLMNSRNLQLACFIYTVGAFAYNVSMVILIRRVGSILFSISLNFSLIMTWMVDLFIFCYINPTFGEAWTKYSYLQIAGIAVLLYGSALYNAPNKGSLLLEGQWWAFGIDCSKEYSTIKREQEEANADVEVDDLDEPLLLTTSNEGLV